MPELTDRPPLTISIVSHGQQALILPLLEQLARLCGPLVHRVVLTVNIPEPDLLADAPAGLPLLRLDNPEPLGFGANNNQAFGHCETPWFLVLNPDIRLDHDVLSTLLARAAPDAGLLAPRILEPGKTGPEQHRALLTPREILGRRKPGYAIPAAPDWIPGLFMLFRSQAYRQIGGFDERFFMYGEDFDICARLRLAGWRIQIAEDEQARHEAQRDSHRRMRPLWWHVSSLLRVWGSPTFWRYRRLLAQESVAAPRR